MRATILLALSLAWRGLYAEEPFHLGTLHVQVESAEGLALPGATVAICSNGTFGYSAYSESNGIAEFRVPALRYVLVVSLSGHVPVTVVPVSLVPAQDVFLRVTLRIDPRFVTVVTPSPLARSGPGFHRPLTS